MLAAQILAGALAVYYAVGLMFALWFVASAVDRFDPAATHAGLGFRALILPGVAALWPLLAIRLLRRNDGPATGSPAGEPYLRSHRVIWTLLAILLPALLGLSLAARMGPRGNPDVTWESRR